MADLGFISYEEVGTHTYDKGVIIQPTMKEQGYTLFTCTVCGQTKKDNYTEILKKEVVRLYGADRYTTAFMVADALKEQLDVEKFDTVIVACGDNFADALAGSYLAAKKEAPILLVRNDKVQAVKQYIENNLEIGGTVYLLGGKAVVSETLETELDDFKVKRLWGSTRYETNLAILEETGVYDSDILICTGETFADSLSASATGLPIMLVKDTLSDAQEEFLKKNVDDIYVIGGTGAVNKNVERKLTSYGYVMRIGGATRYETSVEVAETFFYNPKSAVLAYAQNFPDGLSGGPLAISKNAPLILTMTGKELTAATYTRANEITSGVVLGGPALISDVTAKKIFNTNKIEQFVY